MGFYDEEPKVGDTVLAKRFASKIRLFDEDAGTLLENNQWVCMSDFYRNATGAWVERDHPAHMRPWVGCARDLVPEMQPDELVVVSLFEKAETDEGPRALRSWLVKDSEELRILCDKLENLIEEYNEHNQYALSYSATLVPKREELTSQSIETTFKWTVQF